MEVKILEPGNKKLRIVSSEVTDFSKDYTIIIEEIKKACLERKAYAAAAPQFGINERFIVIMTAGEMKNIDDPIKYDVQVYFNPKIICMQGCQIFYESCMSVPDTIGKVKRPYYLELIAQDIHGDYMKKHIEGFETIIFCHEIDHLDGIEYTDKAADIHYDVKLEDRMAIRKKYPHKVISETGEFNQDELPIKVRTLKYND